MYIYIYTCTIYINKQNIYIYTHTHITGLVESQLFFPLVGFTNLCQLSKGPTIRAWEY